MISFMLNVVVAINLFPLVSSLAIVNPGQASLAFKYFI